MADVKWIKITTDIFDDEKILLIESLPESDSLIVIWFKLLCLAGKTNNSGVFMLNDKIAYTDKTLSTIFRRKEAVVQMALSTFEQLGMVKIVDGVITIPSWGKHQSLDKLEERKEYMRGYMAQYREKQKLLAGKVNGDVNGKVNSKVNVNTLDKEEDKEEDKENTPLTPLTPQRGDAGRKLKKGQVIKMTPSEDFERFWKAYPRRDGKQEAWRAWSNAEIDSTLTDKIIDHVNRRRNLWEWKKEGGQYIPHASTFINQRRWEDDLTGKPIGDPKNKNAFTSYAQHNSGYSWDDIDAFSIDDIALNLDGEDG